MVAPVALLADPRGETLAPQLDSLPEVRDGLVELPLLEGDQAQIVVAFGVGIEAESYRESWRAVSVSQATAAWAKYSASYSAGGT